MNEKLDNVDSFYKKLQDAYKQSLFRFLQQHATGKTKDVQTITTDTIGLHSFYYVLQHPNTDIEAYYIRELINIFLQKELDSILPYMLKHPYTDDTEYIIIGNPPKSPIHASFFKCAGDTVCFPKSALYVQHVHLLLHDTPINIAEELCDASVHSVMILGVTSCTQQLV